MSTGNAQSIPLSSSQSAPTQQITIYLNPAVPTSTDHSHHLQHSTNDHHQLMPPKIGATSGETYQISPMQPVSSGDLQNAQQSFIHVGTHNAATITTTTTTPAVAAALSSSSLSSNANETTDQNQNINPQEQQGKRSSHDQQQGNQQRTSSDQNSPSATRFKWTEEKSQVAMNLVKYGCKPKLISVAVGCSLRTAQKFAETVTPKIAGESFKTYQIKRRGRKSKDVNQRLNAIREVLSKNSSVTQVEIAADLKVSNTTVCRDLKRLGTSWKEKKNGNNISGDSTLENNNGSEVAIKSEPSTRQTTTARKTRQANSKIQNNTNDNTKGTTKAKRQQRRNTKTNNNNNNTNNTGSNPGNAQDHTATNSNEVAGKPSN